tara:strand:+ start:748 stop:1212 length:465 start_codon:yes stop_codon:yes gene_type:complete
MVNKIRFRFCNFVIGLAFTYETYSPEWLEKAKATHVRNKATVLSVLLGVHLIHTTTNEGTSQGLNESGKLRYSVCEQVGQQGISEVFLLVPNLLFSLYFSIKTLNIVSSFMTYGQLLSIAPYVEMYINTITPLAYAEIFLKVTFLLKRKNNSLV